jgi:hypothetical protein
VPRVPLPHAGCDPHWGGACSVSVGGHCSSVVAYGLIRQCQQAILSPSVFLLEESLQVVASSLLPAGPFRRYLRDSFLGCLVPYPGGPTACLYRCVIGLTQRWPWVGFPRLIRLKRLLASWYFGAADISLRSGLQVCVAPQVVPTAALTAAGQPRLLRPGRTCFITSAGTLPTVARRSPAASGLASDAPGADV